VSSPEDSPPPTELLQSLLRQAGVHGTPESLSLLGASTCSVWALTANGRRYVVRRRLDGDPQLARKELYLGELLRRHGVPAAEMLALVAGEHGVATLSTVLPGLRLDRALAHLAGHDLRSAWRSTGEALRLAHESPCRWRGRSWAPGWSRSRAAGRGGSSRTRRRTSSGSGQRSVAPRLTRHS
jgi:hypothetical protein